MTHLSFQVGTPEWEIGKSLDECQALVQRLAKPRGITVSRPHFCIDINFILISLNTFQLIYCLVWNPPELWAFITSQADQLVIQDFPEVLLSAGKKFYLSISPAKNRGPYSPETFSQSKENWTKSCSFFFINLITDTGVIILITSARHSLWTL